MTRQQVNRINQSKSDSSLAGGIFQRAAVHDVGNKELQRDEESEPSIFKESGFNHDFSQIPVNTEYPPVIQPKLKIGAVGDKYEQEADRVARQVVSQVNAPSQQAVQREVVPEEEDEELQMKPRLQRQPGSRKLTGQQAVQREVMPPEEDEELRMKPMLQRQPGSRKLTGQQAVQREVVSQVNAPSQQAVQRDMLPQEEDEKLQMKPEIGRKRFGETLQREAIPDDDKEIQRKASVQTENKTGLPDNLKAGIENLSGLAMDDVRVHYNSDKPAQLQALAYTQGTEIHVASGQEKHIPHEAWHVVQQKQGRVKPTMQMKDGVSINDDKGLEKEADWMGTRSLQVPTDKRENRKEKVSFVIPKVQQKKTIQRGGARVAKNAEENKQGTYFGIMGIQGLINTLEIPGNQPTCKVGVMSRYPTGMNYIKGRGGHGAIQIQVDFPPVGKVHQQTQYLQAGVSATGSIQIEPIFQTIKTQEGYNIKRIEKTVSKEVCINVLKEIAKEIATAQLYQERIVMNTGRYTNCSLWAAKMAAIAGIELNTPRMLILPSPNDLQHAMDKYRNKEGYTITDSTEIQTEEETNTNVGLVTDPEQEVNDEVLNAMKLWARREEEQRTQEIE
jgi:hypothetical protein